MYYGWNLGNHSYGEWITKLWTEYNNGLPENEQITIDKVFGYYGAVRFLDVAKIAMEVFDYRTNPHPPAQN
jgi:hypothetical protein